jgi:hypothetical protein
MVRTYKTTSITPRHSKRIGSRTPVQKAVCATLYADQSGLHTAVDSSAPASTHAVHLLTANTQSGTATTLQTYGATCCAQRVQIAAAPSWILAPLPRHPAPPSLPAPPAPVSGRCSWTQSVFDVRGLGFKKVARTKNFGSRKASALRINLNIQGCSVIAPPLHAPSHAPLLLPLLLSHNIPLPRVHLCVMGRLVHTGLGS